MPARSSYGVIVVTGGSAGIGRAIAMKFARKAWRVCAIGRSPEGVESVRREIEAFGGEAMAFSADVSDAAALERAADEVVRKWGAIDVWVNDAMVTMFSPLSEMSAEEFRRVTEVTYLGCVYGTMAALRQMRAQNKGTIIQIGSALTYRAIPLQSAYCGAKFAIRGFTDALRSELIHDGSKIRLAMIQLPAVNTPQFDWARNNFPVRPQPLPPIFQPEAIAEKVYSIAQRPPRELWIGFSTLKAIIGAVAVPAWLDRYLAGTAYTGQFTKQRAAADSVDNLFEPAPFGHVIEGRFSERAKSKVIAIRASWFRGAAASAASLLLLGVGALAYVAGRRRDR